jgi:uracil-DNA glycosylase family 4
VRTKGIEALNMLADAYEQCQRCPALCESRSQVVFGTGMWDARIVVVGKAPEADEDGTGIPFNGDAGRLLVDLFAHAWPETEEMADIGTLEDDDSYFDELREYLDRYIFWTNLVLCRAPENGTSRDGTPTFRDPTTAERKECRDRLDRTIYAIDPLLIVGVGKTAASALMGAAVQITQKRGNIYDIAISSPVTGLPVRYPMLTLMDPGFLMKKGDQDLMLKGKGNSYKTKEDIKWALSLLQDHHRAVYRMDFPLESENG